MAYVVTGTCTKDEHCLDTCPVNCIHPSQTSRRPHNFIIDCGVCIPVCPTTSIFNLGELPAELQEFVQNNAAYW
jgi:NAD-dependent dihydropyrimidine dehydrogenase PreA subunit